MSDTLRKANVMLDWNKGARIRRRPVTCLGKLTGPWVYLNDDKEPCWNWADYEYEVAEVAYTAKDHVVYGPDGFKAACQGTFSAERFAKELNRLHEKASQ